MVTILFVRSIHDLARSIGELNLFLAHARNPVDDFVTICIRGALDEGFPDWQSDPGIFEALSLNGPWTYCWLNGSELGLASSSQRRRLVLGQLAKSGFAVDLILPVFASGEPVSSCAAEHKALRADYPGLIGTSWFSFDRATGALTQTTT